MSDHLFLDPLAEQPADTAKPAVADAGAYESFTPSNSITRHVDIPLAQDRAIEAFTEYTHLWWPLELRSSGPEGHLEFTGGELVEEAEDGTTHTWASIDSVAPGELHLDWRGASPAAELGHPVCVRFRSNNGQERTAVSMETDATEVLSTWSVLLDAFARFTGGTSL